MGEPIIPLDRIRAQATAAANSGQKATPPAEFSAQPYRGLWLQFYGEAIEKRCAPILDRIPA